MPTIPKHLQIRRINNLVITICVFVVIEKPGITASAKFSAVYFVPTIAQMLQIRSIDISIAGHITKNAAEQGKG